MDAEKLRIIPLLDLTDYLIIGCRRNIYGTCERKLSLDKLVEKAKKLLRGHRVEFLGGGIYNVVGDHGTYAVAQDYEGKVSCNCPGFVKKGKCSHSTAVLILTKSSRRRRPRRSK